MQSALNRCNHEIRIALRLPLEAVRTDRDRLLPSELVRALNNLEAATTMDIKIPENDALKLIVVARQQTVEFVGIRRQTTL